MASGMDDGVSSLGRYTLFTLLWWWLAGRGRFGIYVAARLLALLLLSMLFLVRRRVCCN